MTNAFVRNTAAAVSVFDPLSNTLVVPDKNKTVGNNAGAEDAAATPTADTANTAIANNLSLHTTISLH